VRLNPANQLPVTSDQQSTTGEGEKHQLQDMKAETNEEEHSTREIKGEVKLAEPEVIKPH
jgi:hypothetical protein